MIRAGTLAILTLASALRSGEFPRTLYAWPGRTPQLDGVLSPG